MINKYKGYKKLKLNMSKGTRMEKTHFWFEEEELFSSSLLQNPLQTWEKSIKLKSKSKNYKIISLLSLYPLNIIKSLVFIDIIIKVVEFIQWS